MPKEKRGAIELGMNVIVIIVIGITLLSLALVWVKGMMSKMEDITDQIPGDIDSQINQIMQGGQDFGITPSSVTLSQGEKAEVVMFYRDSGESENKGVVFHVSPVEEEGSKVNFNCKFASTLKPDSKSYDIASGEDKKLKILIQADAKSSLGNGICEVTASGLDVEDTIMIEIK